MNHKPRVMCCPNCKKNNRTHNSSKYVTPAAYFSAYINKEDTYCKYCGCRLSPMNIDVFEFGIIADISGDPSFIIAMDDLKQKDPIEFQLKMSQFKTQLQQQKGNEQIENSNLIHCPKCDSTAITTGARGVNNFWGLLGASKTVNRCGNCGYTWKPNNW